MKGGIYQRFKCSDCGHICNAYQKNDQGKYDGINFCPKCNVKLVRTPLEDVLSKMIPKIEKLPRFIFNKLDISKSWSSGHDISKSWSSGIRNSRQGRQSKRSKSWSLTS